MTISPIGRAVCKVGAAFLFVSAARSLAWASPGVFYAEHWFNFFAVASVVAFIAPTLGGIFLWKYADRLPHSREDVQLTQEELVEGGLFLVGVYAVVFGFVIAANTEIADWTIRMMDDSDYPSNVERALLQNWAERAAYVVQIGLGAYLIFGRESLMNFFHKARRLGASKPGL